jgi:phosphoribosylamine--glycine ligase
MLANVLVIGGGGREHAISRSLKLSPKVGQLFIAPGNAGMAALGTLVNLNLDDIDAVAALIDDQKIKLTVIGPEAPLVAGLSDALRSRGHLVVGASQKAAQLEGSKIYAKEFMQRHGIPTADYRIFDDAKAAKSFVRSQAGQKFRVLKADGLAAGKGVVVASSADELVTAISEIMEEKKFGAAGARILLEETLKGPEVSLMALTDGHTALPLPASQDHKRVFDKDKGPNTGGMGAYAPTPFYDDATRVHVNKHIIDNFVRGLAADKLDFRGVIYFGLMLTKQGPKVLEFNVRLGDPEAEVVLPLIESDMYEIFKAVAAGLLSNVRLQVRAGAACTVVMTSGGYPGTFATGLPITGLDSVEREQNVFVFHAGTKQNGSSIVTAGGRVLSVTGLGRTLETAVVRAYQGVKKISFQNAYFRRDIAEKAFRNKSIVTRIKRMSKRHQKSVAA